MQISKYKFRNLQGPAVLRRCHLALPIKNASRGKHVISLIHDELRYRHSLLSFTVLSPSHTFAQLLGSNPPNQCFVVHYTQFFRVVNLCRLCPTRKSKSPRGKDFLNCGHRNWSHSSHCCHFLLCSHPHDT